jgi:hypothetical protein
MIYFDTETVGLYGPIVTLQYAEDEGDIFVHDVWLRPIRETLSLIDDLCHQQICGFNLTFDWFHICQLYTTLSMFRDDDIVPIEHVDEYINNEEEARLGLCCKPAAALDLMLHARKGVYQSTMPRKPIRIKRIPTFMAYHVAKWLSDMIPFNDIYFAKNSDPKERWKIRDIKNDANEIDADFKDIVLEFNPSSALKALISDALKINTEEIKLFRQVELPRRYFPVEFGFAPFCKAVERVEKFKYKSWRYYINKHVEHWSVNSAARQYAADDVKYTRLLRHYFGDPEPGDLDSTLACMVGAIRWRGFAIDKEAMRDALKEGKAFLEQYRKVVNHNATESCKSYLKEVMSDTEYMLISKSTKKVLLEEISKWTLDKVCDACGGLGCDVCGLDGVIKTDAPHPAAERAQIIIDLRNKQKELENYKKLILAGRFHVSLNIIGAKSNRMSGADGLNAQGIKHEKTIRKMFTLADVGYQLDGGDFDSFEVSLMEAVYADPLLRKELLSGKKIHAMFGMCLFPGKTYEEVIASKDAAVDMYSLGKRGVFGLCYGGDENTLVTRLGVEPEVAKKAFDLFMSKYVVMRDKRKQFFDMFCSMRQPNGIGTKVEWHEPADYIESMLGFRRYFTLENRICKALFDLAENPPKEWTTIKTKVIRRVERGEQTVCGSIRSALFAAAFAQQAANMRAAGNHVIQSPGATITKMLQEVIWRHQPHGINDWLVAPFNVHDEVMSVNHPSISDAVRCDVETFVSNMKSKVPLISMTWKTNMESWAAK